MSLKKIAEMTGLSITTVSHAINGTRPVSAASKKKIAESIKAINFKPNLAARMMKTSRSKTVVLIIPATEPNNSTNCFFFDVLNGAKTALEKHGYSLIISTYPENVLNFDLSLIPILQRIWVDGILLVPPSNSMEDIKSIINSNLPIVLIDRKPKGCTLPVVYSDSKTISYKAVSLLLDSGRKRVAFLGVSSNNPTCCDRYAGYCEALYAHGIPVDKTIVRFYENNHASSLTEIINELIEHNIDSIFSANSMLALNVLKVISERNLKIPEDIAVIGFENLDWTQVTNPPLTAIVQDANAMGYRAAEILVDILAGNQPKESCVVLPAKLIKRKSHSNT
ncbi:MAG TPA: LacI family transcriptional regulator [Clostridiaceae bacterium]|nr:LacI family transcriptional regulator [Clostridiaceae bacterium]